MYNVTVTDKRNHDTYTVRNVPANTKTAAYIMARRQIVETEGVPRDMLKLKKAEEVRQCSANTA